jgi:hypothetical protein
VPVRRNLTFMGMGEGFLCPDFARMIRWAFERGHKGSISTTLRGATKDDIDALADLPFTDTILHVPGDDDWMKLTPTPEWLELFRYAIERWKWCGKPPIPGKPCSPDFVLSVFHHAPHPAVAKVWDAAGIPRVCFGLHDRSGLVPWLPHGDRGCPVPLCGKMFCGGLMPNGDIVRCCSDYAQENVWGNLFTMTYAACFRSPAYRAYMRSLSDPAAHPRCRHCMDGYHFVNPDDEANWKAHGTPVPED